jgi:peptidyl-prolyl cis-trans isomerase D
MSVIQRIQSKQKWVFGIIALALFIFVIEDYFRGNHSSNTDTVGKVNGEKIKKEDFEQKLNLYSRGGDRNSIIPQLWQQEVDQIIMQQEYDKLGLVVSNKELSDLLYGENSPFKREKELIDPATGQLDVAKTKQIISNLKKSKNTQQLQQLMEVYIDPMVQQALRTKYQNLLQHSLYVPSWLIEKQRSENSAIASISYVYVPYSTIVDSTIKVSDDEILAYVKKHPQGFEKDEETRNFSYVGFDITPSKSDSSAVIDQLNNLKNEFIASKDLKVFFAKNSSEMEYSDMYLGSKQIQQPVKDSLFKLVVGQTYGPYLDGHDYVLAKMVGVKPIPDSAKVRHILVSTHSKDETGNLVPVRDDETAKKRMDSIKALIAGGAKWDSVCAKYSDDGGSKDKGGVYEYFATGSMVPEFNNFSFEGKPGERKVVKTAYGYHYIEILSQKGAQLAYNIAYMAKPINVSSETINNATTAAQQFAASSKTKQAFDDNAKKINKTPLLGEAKENDFNVQGFQGSARPLVRWLYENGVGTIGEPMQIGERYIVPIITAVNKKGLPTNAAQVRPQVEPYVRNEKKAKQIIETKFKGNSLESYSASSGSQIQRADSIVFTNGLIPGIGNDNKVIGAAFNKSLQGKTSEPIAGSTGVTALKVEGIGAKPNASLTDESIKETILQGFRVAAGRVNEALKKMASITDNRSKIY